VYYQRKTIHAEDLELMRLIDEQYLKTLFYGSQEQLRAKFRGLRCYRVDGDGRRPLG